MGTAAFIGESCKTLSQHILNENTVTQLCSDSTTRYLPILTAAVAAYTIGTVGAHIYRSMNVDPVDTPDLHLSAQYGQLKSVKLAIQRKVDLDIPDPLTGDTALHIALANRHMGVVRALLEAGADVNAVNKMGETVLHQACKFSDPDTVELMIQKGTNVNARDQSGNTPLTKTSDRGHVLNVRSLIRAKGIDLNVSNEKGNTALHLAIAKGHRGVVRALLEAGADVNAVNEKGETVLHQACKLSDPDTIALMIQKGANVNARDERGNTSLSIAYSCNHLLNVRALIRAKDIDPNVSNEDGESILHIALANQHTGVVRDLLQLGADVDAVNGKGETALHLACKFSDSDIVEYIIQKGAQVNACDKERNTPLMIASSLGYLDHVKALTQAKHIDLNVQNAKGETALNLAAREYTKILQVLLNAKANPNIPNSEGQIPLHKAVDQENIEALKLLLACTDNLNCQDINGNTPLHLTANHVSSRLKSAEILLGCPDISSNLLNKEGESPLHLACYAMTGDIDLALMLIKSKKCNFYLQTHSKDPKSEAYKAKTAAHIALESNHIKLLTELLKAGPHNLASKDGKLTEITHDDRILGLIYASLTEKELLTERREGLSLIDWATIYCYPSIEEVLNSNGIYFTLTEQNKEELQLKALEVMVAKWLQFFEDRFPLRIKEFRELKEDIAALKKGEEKLLQPELVELCKIYIEAILKKRHVVSLHKQSNSHCFASDFLIGSYYESEWYLKFFATILSEEISKEIKQNLAIRFNREELIQQNPELAQFFETEISLNQVEKLIPLLNGIINLGVSARRAQEEYIIRLAHNDLPARIEL